MRRGWEAGRFWLVFFSLILLAGALRAENIACSDIAPCGTGFRCEEGACTQNYFCSTNDDCAGNEYCNGNLCMPLCSGPRTACGSSMDCGSNICNSSGLCAEPGTTAVDYGGIYVWVALSVAIAAAFIGLAYMVSRLLELQVLEAWVKIELQELMASIVIAVLCISMVASLDAAALGLTGDGSAIGAAGAFLKKVHTDGQAVYLAVGKLYYNAARISSYSYTAGINVEIMSMSLSSSPAAGLSPLVGEIGQGMDSVANFMLLAAAQYSFLQFFKAAAVVLLPIGIFLRSFSLTRKIGGVVLASAIAAAVIYPASFVVSNSIYSVFSPGMIAKASAAAQHTAEAGNPPLTKVVCNPFMQRFVMSPIPFLGGELGWSTVICTPRCAVTAVVGGFSACWYGCYDVIEVVYYIMKAAFPLMLFPFLSSYVPSSPSELVNMYYSPAFNYALPAVAQYAVLSIVAFLAPVIITIVLLRNLAIAFGGEPQLYGISKLV